MVRGGVYEQFRGALLGVLWGIHAQSLGSVVSVTELCGAWQGWLQDPSETGEGWAALPVLLAAWQQPFIQVPAALEPTQALLHEYLAAAWQATALVKPVSGLAAATAAETRVRYGLAIAPRNLWLAQQILGEEGELPLLGGLFGAYWGALALPTATFAHWTPALAQVLAQIMSQWCGGQWQGLGLAPAGRLRPRPQP